jgi:hypothetical protein
MDKKTTIEQLVLEEYISANEKFPMFSSSHEAWAVLKEEIEEFADECYGIFNPISDLWRFVKTNDVNSQKDVLLLIKNHALRASEELIQVMAMIHKYEMYLAKFPEETAF